MLAEPSPIVTSETITGLNVFQSCLYQTLNLTSLRIIQGNNR